MKDNEKKIDKSVDSGVLLPEQNNETEIIKKVQRKNKTVWIYFVVLASIVLIIAITMGVFLGVKSKPSSKVSITVDPIVVSSEGETHVDGGQLLRYNDNKVEKYTANIDIGLSYGQYFIYDCKIQNDSDSELCYSFELNNEVCENAVITYSIDDQAEVGYFEPVENCYLNTKQTVVLKIYFRVIDENENALVRGKYEFNISTKEN